VVWRFVSMMSVLVIEVCATAARLRSNREVDETNWDLFATQRFLRGALASTYPLAPERAGRRARTEGHRHAPFLSAPSSRIHRAERS